ncbi:MAG: hypothetical protein EAZ91_00425 [Cytophagales bacterium]|nr:MAG: hypothetical protein EAZ91_00425 [Cytophagales bacterium]
MKITGIDIGEYRQFKNIKFDFTYPDDYHVIEKRGQPLDKVCFIGQSGTGKTTLLNVIWDFFQVVIDSYQRMALANDPIHNEPYTTFDSIKISSTYEDTEIILDYETLEEYLNLDKELGYSVLGYHWIKGLNIYDSLKHQEKTKKLCLYMKDSVSREADAFLFNQKESRQTFSDFVKTDIQLEKEKSTQDERINATGSKKIVSLGDMQSLTAWQFLLRDIDNYDEATVTQITSIIQNTPKDKVTEELQRWVDSDPRIKLAEECLNPILSKFFLEIDDSEKGKIPVTLRTNRGVKIPNNILSTGTRQLLATAIPIYKFDTNGTVILFDEPERSLFPDIQRGLVKYYTGLAPEAQFFFATHSPIIAAAFEPCERFILYFDENGEVNYRKGEAPIGDDPNDVLRKDFWMNPLMHEEGLAAYRKYLDLATRIRNEMDEDKKNQLIVERLELGNLYNFAGQHAPY